MKFAKVTKRPAEESKPGRSLGNRLPLCASLTVLKNPDNF